MAAGLCFYLIRRRSSEGNSSERASTRRMADSIEHAVEKGKEGVESAAGKGKEGAKQAVDKTKEAAGRVKEGAQQAAGQAKEAAGQVKDGTWQAAGQAKDAAGQAKDASGDLLSRAGCYLGRAEEGLRNTAEELSEEVKNSMLANRREGEDGGGEDSRGRHVAALGGPAAARPRTFRDFMEGSPCRREFEEWEKCFAAAEGRHLDSAAECLEKTCGMRACLKWHPEAYWPLLEIAKRIEEEKAKRKRKGEEDLLP